MTLNNNDSIGAEEAGASPSENPEDQANTEPQGQTVYEFIRKGREAMYSPDGLRGILNDEKAWEQVQPDEEE